MGQSYKKPSLCGNCNIRVFKKVPVDFDAEDSDIKPLQALLSASVQKKLKGLAHDIRRISQNITFMIDNPQKTESTLATLGESIVGLNQIVSNMATFYNNIHYPDALLPHYRLFFDRDNKLNVIEFYSPSS